MSKRPRACQHLSCRVVRIVLDTWESAPYVVCCGCGIFVEAEPVRPRAIAVAPSAFAVDGARLDVLSERLPFLGALRLACSHDVADNQRAFGSHDVSLAARSR
jgi:hypothetical protein